jgi:hypothetical protein
MKKCFIISFDLQENRDYKLFINSIKSYGTWARITESTYAVVTEFTATDIRNHLIKHLNPNDRIFVVKTGGRAAWRHAIADSEWLKKYIPLM